MTVALYPSGESTMASISSLILVSAGTMQCLKSITLKLISILALCILDLNEFLHVEYVRLSPSNLGRACRATLICSPLACARGRTFHGGGKES